MRATTQSAIGKTGQRGRLGQQLKGRCAGLGAPRVTSERPKFILLTSFPTPNHTTGISPLLCLQLAPQQETFHTFVQPSQSRHGFEKLTKATVRSALRMQPNISVNLGRSAIRFVSGAPEPWLLTHLLKTHSWVVVEGEQKIPIRLSGSAWAEEEENKCWLTSSHFSKDLFPKQGDSFLISQAKGLPFMPSVNSLERGCGRA